MSRVHQIDLLLLVLFTTLLTTSVLDYNRIFR